MISEGSYDTEDWTNGIWKFIFANKWHTNYNIITVLYANFGEHKAQEFPHMICFIFLYKNTHSFFLKWRVAKYGDPYSECVLCI